MKGYTDVRFLMKFEFPFKLHAMLKGVERDGLSSKIVSWQPHGKAFKIHKPKDFASSILPKYFAGLKFRSFQRQLQIYGFKRIRNKNSPDYNAYYHELFQKGNSELSLDMKRDKIKGRKVKEDEKPEPNFYLQMEKISCRVVVPSKCSYEQTRVKNRSFVLQKLEGAFIDPIDVYPEKSHQVPICKAPLSSIFDVVPLVALVNDENEEVCNNDMIQQARKKEHDHENMIQATHHQKLPQIVDENNCQEFDRLDLVRYFEGL